MARPKEICVLQCFEGNKHMLVGQIVMRGGHAVEGRHASEMNTSLMVSDECRYEMLLRWKQPVSLIHIYMSTGKHLDKL